MLLLALLAQASAPTTTVKAAPPPERFSILAPVPGEPCRPGPAEGEVLVCGKTLPSQRLPYPEEAAADKPRASNPELSGARALELTRRPYCADRPDHCVSGGIPILPMAVMAGKALIDAMRPKPDKSKRVPIPLDDPPVSAE